jgi:hypothetical protein
VQEQFERDRGARLRKFSPRDERRRERGDVQGSGEPDVGGLAKLARGVVLPAIMDMCGGKNDKQECADAQRDCRDSHGVSPGPIAPVPVSHFRPPQTFLDAARSLWVTRREWGGGIRHLSPLLKHTSTVRRRLKAARAAR